MRAAIAVCLLALLWVPALAVADKLCSPLGVRDCIATRGCVLDCTNPGSHHCEPYVCRPAANACEGTIPQVELTRERCEKIGDCEYRSAGCFCPGPATCTCGGGPPQRCRKRAR